MNTTRVINLTLVHLVTDKVRLGLLFAGLFALLFFICVVFETEIINNLYYNLLSFFALVFVSSGGLLNYYDSQTRCQWLTMPASGLEKWFVCFVISAIVAPLFATLTFLAATTFYNLTFGALYNPPESIALQLKYLFIGFQYYWLSHALVFFGVVYFKSKPIIKTVSVAAFAALLFIVYFILLYMIFPSLFQRIDGSQELVQPTNFNLYTINRHLFYFFEFATVLFFWSLSLIRIREIDAT